MTDHSPITPPPELVEQWYEMADNSSKDVIQEVAAQAARWGSDQELEACCEWLTSEGLDRFPMRGMREARRPKPPSLKEQALAVVENSAICDHLSPEHEAILRQALEQLDD